MNCRHGFITAGCILALAIGSRSASAVVCVWDGGATTNLASNPTNWVDDVAPTNTGDTVVFNATSAKSVLWNLNVTIGSWTQEVAYTGTATIYTVYGSSGFTNLAITGDCVLNGGAWTHQRNTSAQNYRLRASIGGNFTVGSGAKITATGIGYSNGNAPAGSGGTYQKCGASHGGQGSRMEIAVGVTYGNPVDPVAIGSGGVVGGPNDGHGGGAVYITVAGSTSIAGTIEANAYPSTSSASAGAGGSVCLRTGSLSGNGTLQANGDKQGGGGRVALIVTNDTSLGSVAMQAFGGAEANYPGAAGTVYKEVQGQSPGAGTLVIDNNNRGSSNFGSPPFAYASTLMPTASTWNAAVNLGNFSAIIVTNKGVLGINRDTTLNWGTAALSFAGVTNSYVSFASTNATTFPSTMVVSNFTLLADTSLAVSGTWIVRTNGAISYSVPNDRAQAPFVMAISGDLTVDPGAAVSVEGMGYRNNTGPGIGSWTPNRGGSHGGQGGVSSWLPGQTYGSFLTPTNFGSGGVSGGQNLADAGGAMRLVVSGTCIVNGVLNANAKVGYSGSGGSIWLIAGSLSGSGVISANGALGSSGGGGRVAVILTNGTSIGSVALQAFGGTSGSTPGAAGTIYVQTAAQASGRGTLLVNNNNVVTTTNMVTHLPPLSMSISNELQRVSVTVTNGARLTLTADQTVGDIWLPSANSFLDLNYATLRVNSPARHELGSGTVTNRGAIIWRVYGSVYVMR